MITFGNKHRVTIDNPYGLYSNMDKLNEELKVRYFFHALQKTSNASDQDIHDKDYWHVI